MVLRARGKLGTAMGIALSCVLQDHTLAQDTPPQAQPTVELPPTLARVLDEYARAWVRKDAAALAALFSEDGFVLSGGEPPVRGRAAIRKLYTGRGGPLALRAFHYATDGRIGYILGGYARAAGLPDAGKFTLTLRQDADGRWLIVSDMDNGNSRP
jgi:ketosteroid isomerase-like protein